MSARVAAPRVPAAGAPGLEPAAAFAAYLGIRGRLPPCPRQGRAKPCADLSEAARGHDLVLLDAYGVLNRGETAIPGAAARVAALRAAGKAVMVVSNSAAYPRAHMMARWRRLGFDFTDDEVVSSRDALLARIAGLRRHWGAMLDEGHDLGNLRTLSLRRLGDCAADYAAVEGFLLIGAGNWTERRQSLLAEALREGDRPVLCGNPDLVAPRDAGLSLEPGYWAHRLMSEAGARVEFLGKPFPEIFDMALARQPVPVAPDRVLMVGDTLHTDVLGGAARGFATALVTGHGALREVPADEQLRRAAILPDFVLPAI
ncbi:HAD-IIA family hydrolase [Frigidibacter sp. MR17.24]|uniref:HAD-IIA family hydrolase n=1 Tax=Frigidibacter sp. MR17.24 TaxID=3127345 RepID=UPI003012F398